MFSPVMGLSFNCLVGVPRWLRRDEYDGIKMVASNNIIIIDTIDIENDCIGIDRHSIEPA